MSHLYFLMVFAGYLVSFVFYFINFEFKKNNWGVWAKRCAWISLVSHFIFLCAAYFKSGGASISNLSEYIETVSLVILAASFFIEAKFKAKFLMLFSLPIVLIFCLFAIVMAERPSVSLNSQTPSYWLAAHTFLIITGFSGLVIAVASAAMYTLQSWQLKSKHLGNIFEKFPALSVLDRLHFISLAWGVILFSLGILSGFLWAHRSVGPGEIIKDPTVILSFVTCFMYWVILSFRFSPVRRERQIAAGTVLVFILLFLTLVASSYSPTNFHRGF